MADAVASGAQSFDVPVSFGITKNESARGIRVSLPFIATTRTSFLIDLTLVQNTRRMTEVESMYVDNSANAVAISFQFDGLPQIITVPPWCQAYLPVLSAKPAKIVATCNATVSVVAIFVNFPVSPLIWGTTGTFSFDVNGYLNVTQEQFLPGADDGSITTGGTAQNLFSGVLPLHSWAVYNPNATDTLWVSDSVTAAPNGAGSIPILPGGGYETPLNYKSNHAISIYGATTGDKYTARRW